MRNRELAMFTPLRASAEGKNCISVSSSILLTIFSIQVVWSVILANGTPYLLSLGMPGYITAITWMAAPLCGTFVQPYMGALSDNYRSKYGRRRPFIVFGALGTLSSIFLLAYVEQLVSVLDFLFLDDLAKRQIICTAAFILVWSLGFWIQPLQVGARALLVDLFPEAQQLQASASATYYVGCGNLIGAASGLTTLPKLLGLTRWTQFQCLCLIATIALSSTVTLGCFLSSEPTFAKETARGGMASIRKSRLLKQLHTSFNHLTTIMYQVLVVQFFSWMAWFPFLYYGTSYMSSICEFSQILPEVKPNRQQLRIMTYFLKET
jgi:solute carrier family 45, member 1/2/4